MLLKYGVHKRGANETLLLCFRFMLRIFFGVLGIIVTTDGFHRKGSNLWLCLQDSCLYSATTSGSVMFCSGSIHSLILLQSCTIDVIKNG